MNVARILFIGATKLHYTETELFCMTPRKFFRIYDEYMEMNGIKKTTYAIDDIFDAL